MNKLINKRNIIIILFILTMIFMTIGFALYNKTLDLGGTVTLTPNGDVYIASVSTVSLVHATANPEYTSSNVEFHMQFTTTNPQQSADDYVAVFDITINNDSFFDYKYYTPDYVARINKLSNSALVDSSYLNYEVTGINSGDIIPKCSSRTFRVTFTFTNPLSTVTDTYVINGDFEVDVSDEKIARLIGRSNDTTGNLRGSNNYAAFTMNVINTYDTAQTFTIAIDDPGFEIISVNGSSTTYQINANDDQTFTFYIGRVANSVYLYDAKRLDVYLVTSNNESLNTGRVTVLVDKNGTYDDFDPPQISNVRAEENNVENSVVVSWTGTDINIVTNYKVLMYVNGTFEEEYETGNDNTSLVINNLNTQDNYSFKVYGIDSVGNYPTQTQIDGATTSAGPASISANKRFKWRYTVTYSLTNLSHSSGEDYAIIKNDYTGGISASGVYSLPNSISVSMDGTNNPTYNYSNRDGSITIQNVTGNITITATANGCLTEGTKVLLYGGKYKNIEDITYEDLLAVYDHINGGITYVYPAWIEKERTDSAYEKITFSDGSTLNFVNSHALFDVDKKEFVGLKGCDTDKIGTRVYKIINGKLKVVEITNIEHIEQSVRYYNIVSTRLYNVIANDFLTADITSSISNIYGFKDEARYKINYYLISAGPKLKYEKVQDWVPHYLYEGFNLQNGLALISSKIDADFLKEFIEEETLEPITKDGEYYFTVTTSLDNLNEEHLYKEGSTYKLPEGKMRYYEDTSNKNRYKPGEEFTVYNNTHFEAIYSN